MRKQFFQFLGEIRRPMNGRARSIGDGVLIPWVSQQNGKVSGGRKDCKSVRTEKIEIDERAKEILPPAVAVEEQQVPIGVINLLEKLLSPRKVQHSFQCTRLRMQSSLYEETLSPETSKLARSGPPAVPLALLEDA